ncbi:U2 snRNP-associated SURP motif-containing protein-like isoform X1 [Clytia hemisphaerica]|uniref:U2 snRNP-associated SURP motif-containing protein n=1 Tax=Clytia hemisphaerica TaxID=252671 RepID=A0A7M5UUQ6_9CNID
MSSKPNKFVKGHNALKPKIAKPLTKSKELQKKKAEEAETAAVLNEYLADFQTGAAGGKTFVRSGTVNPGKGEVPTMDSGKVYKPKSKMQQLAEEFRKSKEITNEYKLTKDLKKKAQDKKKSNLELFKEELQQSQKERDIRRKLRTGDLSGISEEVLNSLPPAFFNDKAGEDEFSYQYGEGGSRDTGDPSTTNLFVSNINPLLNEEQMCKIFGRYGPLASVKIMWPRTDEEKSRNRNCGFVAFMTRKDGERALDDLEGKYVMDFEMKLGWGKNVPIPPQPIYVHPSQSHIVRPPKQSGLPFNCQLPYKQRKENLPFDGNLEITVVKVVIPTERNIVSIINRMVEFVVREGPMFEAMIMNREIANPMYRFLFDNKSNEHVYYRWRLFAMLQGDTTHKWNQKCFRMYVGGSIWQPPSSNPYGSQVSSSGMTASAALATASTAIVHGNVKVNEEPNPESLAAKKNMLLKHLLKEEKEETDAKQPPKEKKALSDRNRDKLEDFLRTITTDRTKVGELMFWCIDHAECCEEIVECICESLSILETPIPLKIARLFLVSDILSNSTAKVHNASAYRKVFQIELLEMMENMHKALATCSTKSQTEKFRKQVLACLAAWQDWSLYPPGFLINLQNVFVGISTAQDIKDEEERVNKESLRAKMSAIDGEPLKEEEDDEDDVDGIPLTKDVSEIDGLPLVKQEDDIDGVPIKGKSEDPVALSRWERIEDSTEDEQTKENKSKWEKVEGVKMGKSVKEEEMDSEEEPPRRRDRSPTRDKSDRRSRDNSPDEEDRQRLRDVELKVVRFIDKLEQRGGNKSGLNIQKEAAKFREQLLQQYENAREKKRKSNKSSDRKRERSPSPVPDSKRKKSSKRRSSLSPSPPRSRRRGRSRSRSRSFSPNRNRSYSRSPDRFKDSPIFKTDRSRSRRSYSRSPDSRSRSPPMRRSRSPRRSRTPPRRSRSPSYSPRRNSSSSKKKSKKSKR